jgi:hypothetical protein
VNAEELTEGRALHQAGFLRLADPRQVAEVALDGGADGLRAQMHGKWRNRLLHGEAQGLRVRHCALPPDPNHWLLVADARQQRARGYRAMPARLIAAMAAEDAGAAQIFTAERGGRPLAAMLFIRHGAAATYQVGWAGPEGRAASAHNLLLWRAMNWLAERGTTRLDLGPLDPETPGLTRFKLGSGARSRSLGGTWLQSATLAPAHIAARWLSLRRHAEGARGPGGPHGSQAR